MNFTRIHFHKILCRDKCTAGSAMSSRKVPGVEQEMGGG